MIYISHARRYLQIWRAVVYVGHGSGGTHVGGDRETDAFKAEWFVKVDADTYLFPENVGRFVDAKGWSHEDQHYFGHVLNHRQEDRGLSIGQQQATDRLPSLAFHVSRGK